VSKTFLDTNILVYASDRRDLRKQALATKAIGRCIGERSGVISTQVLQEYVSVALSKLKQDSDYIVRRLRQFESMEVVQLTPALIRRGLELHDLYRIHYWDAMILAAAEVARCSRLWSEDFVPGSLYGLTRAENPLAE